MLWHVYSAQCAHICISRLCSSSRVECLWFYLSYMCVVTSSFVDVPGSHVLNSWLRIITMIPTHVLCNS